MATSRATIGSIFAAIQATANTTVSVVNAVNDSVSMVNRTVSDATRRQIIRSKWDQATYEASYELEKTKEIVQQKQEITDWIGDNKELASTFQSTLETLRAKVAELK